MTLLAMLRGRARRYAKAALKPVTSRLSAGPGRAGPVSPQQRPPEFPHYESLRAGGPVHFLPDHDCWLVIGYEEVKSALAQPLLFSSRSVASIDPVLLGADPPDHEFARRIVARHFSKEALDRLGHFAEAEAGALIRAEFDAVSEYARPLTRKVAARLVGLEQQYVAAILKAMEAPRVPLPSTHSLAGTIRGATLYAELQRDSAGALDDDQLRSLIVLLCLASIETAERVIAQSVLSLFQTDEMDRRIEAQPTLLAPFIEEVMRLHPPEPTIARTTTRTVQLGGHQIAAGARILLSLEAANRDPDHFEDRTELRLDRPRKQHLAFGSGAHQCVGAGLGRRVVFAALSAILRHRPEIRPVQPLSSVEYAITQGVPMPSRLMIGYAP